MFKKEPNVEISDKILLLVELYSYKLNMKGHNFMADEIINDALIEYLTDQLCKGYGQSDE